MVDTIQANAHQKTSRSKLFMVIGSRSAVLQCFIAAIWVLVAAMRIPSDQRVGQSCGSHVLVGHCIRPFRRRVLLLRCSTLHVLAL